MKTVDLGRTVPHFLTQTSCIERVWQGLAIPWWLANLLEDPNDDTDDMTMDTNASHCLWALYDGRRPRLISPGLYPLVCPVEFRTGCIVWLVPTVRLMR